MKQTRTVWSFVIICDTALLMPRTAFFDQDKEAFRGHSKQLYGRPCKFTVTDEVVATRGVAHHSVGVPTLFISPQWNNKMITNFKDAGLKVNLLNPIRTNESCINKLFERYV